jgi:hypothetical protein
MRCKTASCSFEIRCRLPRGRRLRQCWTAAGRTAKEERCVNQGGQISEWKPKRFTAVGSTQQGNLQERGCKVCTVTLAVCTVSNCVVCI